LQHVRANKASIQTQSVSSLLVIHHLLEVPAQKHIKRPLIKINYEKEDKHIDYRTVESIVLYTKSLQIIFKKAPPKTQKLLKTQEVPKTHKILKTHQLPKTHKIPKTQKDTKNP
jgi:hypothetical protein